MNIETYNTIPQANNSFNNQNKKETFFTVKLVKSGLADMLWQLSLLYRLAQLLDYTYVHTPINYDKRYRLNFLGKTIKKIENAINKLIKIDRYSHITSNFLGLDRLKYNINEQKFIKYKIIEVPISEIYQEDKISDIEQLKKYVEEFINEVNPTSKKVIYCLTFTPELYKGLRAFHLYDLLNNADPEAIALNPLKFQLSESYRKAREHRPVNIPFDAAKIKVVIHLRKGDRMLVNVNKKVIGVLSTKVKVVESLSDLSEWENNNYSNSNETYKAYNLLQKTFDKYGKDNFSVIVMSDGYERTFQNIRHAISKGEITLSQEEKRQLYLAEKIANQEFGIFSQHSNVYTIIGESEKNTFPSIHAIVSADIVIKTTGGFAWVLHSLFKSPTRPSTIIQLGQDEDKTVEDIGLFLAENISGFKNI
ncbi:MAG: hypothetical protein KME50_11375 [Nostoc desertorum CM1-VF14]|jgi:hypothetical protein|nr:hypothetical protein [Nostoc desertorum CM1-VF14]